nr:hypothetical protein [uncultured bacterium]
MAAKLRIALPTLKRTRASHQYVTNAGDGRFAACQLLQAKASTL